MQPYRVADVDRQARRLQRKRMRQNGPARQSSLTRREMRRHMRRFYLTVVITSVTFTILWNILFHR